MAGGAPGVAGVGELGDVAGVGELGDVAGVAALGGCDGELDAAVGAATAGGWAKAAEPNVTIMAIAPVVSKESGRMGPVEDGILCAPVRQMDDGRAALPQRVIGL